MCSPIISSYTAVIVSSKKRKLLIKGCLIVPSANSQRHPFIGYKIIQIRNIASITQHFEEWIGEVLVELIPIDGLSRGGSVCIEYEHTVETNVSSFHKRPTNGLAGF